MRFSERMGYEKPKTELQKEGMDKELRNGIWNCLTVNIFDNLSDYTVSSDAANYKAKEHLIERLWLDFFKSTIDTRPYKKRQFIEVIRDWFFKVDWTRVYDFVEFIIENNKNKRHTENFVEDLNSILKRELSAYRIVSSKVTPITSDLEIDEIEKAVDGPVNEVSKHLIRALELLSDRKNPDYRNSIKESISAVETVCKRISENPKATLGDALDQLTKSGKIKFHGAIQSAFRSLYGYTNDADGIRHSLMEEESLDQEDALFMLASCSAFVNYLIVKTLKSGNDLSKK